MSNLFFGFLAFLRYLFDQLPRIPFQTPQDSQIVPKEQRILDCPQIAQF